MQVGPTAIATVQRISTAVRSCSGQDLAHQRGGSRRRGHPRSLDASHHIVALQLQALILSRLCPIRYLDDIPSPRRSNLLRIYVIINPRSQNTTTVSLSLIMIGARYIVTLVTPHVFQGRRLVSPRQSRQRLNLRASMSSTYSQDKGLLLC